MWLLKAKWASIKSAWVVGGAWAGSILDFPGPVSPHPEKVPAAKPLPKASHPNNTEIKGLSITQDGEG